MGYPKIQVVYHGISFQTGSFGVEFLPMGRVSCSGPTLRAKQLAHERAPFSGEPLHGAVLDRDAWVVYRSVFKICGLIDIKRVPNQPLINPTNNGRSPCKRAPPQPLGVCLFHGSHDLFVLISY